jgi:hypothetical protein
LIRLNPLAPAGLKECYQANRRLAKQLGWSVQR